MIIAITGPAGSGKTTVSKALTKKLPKSVNIEVDHVKHFIKNGFRIEHWPSGKEKWVFEQWPLVGDSVGLLAKNFQEKSHDVIINGYMDETAWKAVLVHVQLDYKFLLLPHFDTILERDAQRSGYDVMGKEAIQEHHDDFTNNPFYKSFTKIDSTGQTLEDTVELIQSSLK